MNDSPALPRLQPRPADSHKGDYGRALLVGGSRGMCGAIALAATAALRSGAGLVTVATFDHCADLVAALQPCYMTLPLRTDAHHRLVATAREQIETAPADCLACGPGLGRTSDVVELVAWMYRDLPQPLVVDADGISALATAGVDLAAHAGPRILTPHPGEFRRLIHEPELAIAGLPRPGAADGRRVPDRRAGERTSDAGDGRATALSQPDRQSGNGHRRRGRCADRRDHGAGLPAAATLRGGSAGDVPSWLGWRSGGRTVWPCLLDCQRSDRLPAAGVSPTGSSDVTAKIIRHWSELTPALRQGAVTIGNFDGVHRGHARIVARLIAHARRLGGPAVVFTFDPHPAFLLRPQLAPPPLTWVDRKAELLAELGVEALVAYPTDDVLLAMSPEQFLDAVIVGQLQARALVEGPNFFFGRQRAGDIGLLQRLCTCPPDRTGNRAGGGPSGAVRIEQPYPRPPAGR